jgi:hypothetical protein
LVDRRSGFLDIMMVSAVNQIGSDCIEASRGGLAFGSRLALAVE